MNSYFYMPYKASHALTIRQAGMMLVGRMTMKVTQFSAPVSWRSCVEGMKASRRLLLMGDISAKRLFDEAYMLIIYYESI